MSDQATAPDAEAAEDFSTAPGHLLRRCNQIGVAIFLDECRRFDLTPLQFAALAALDRFGPMDQVGLGGVTALDRTTVVVVLTKLEKRGLIRRSPSRKDRRSKIVAITGAGRRLLSECWPAVHTVQERLTAPLTPDERELLVSLLSRIAEENNALSRAPFRQR